MGRLDSRTPTTWVACVAERPLELLSDQAHCEMRAAASAQALITPHPDKPALVQALCEVAREELLHHAQVVRELDRRGACLAPGRANPYAAGLLALATGKSAERLLDRLLISSLIEARSLERFQLLSEHHPDRALASFYAALVPSEAAHRALFVELARAEFPRARVDARLAELRAAEAAVLQALPFDYRMHSGAPKA